MAHFDTTGLDEAADALAARDIDVLRVGYSDLIGTERGRDLLVNRFARTVSSGVAFCRSVYGTSPMGDVVEIKGGLDAGLPDVLAFPDITTVQDIPWEPGVAHVIADVFNPDGSPSEESPRAVLKRVIGKFAELNMMPIVGPELEFFVLERSTSNPCGWQRYGEALGAADRAFRFKTAVQELARQEDKMATFMAKPFNDEGGSGFHIHFSTWDSAGNPLFDDPSTHDGLSKIAKSAIAGVLAHAPALAAVSNPTINSYKRFGPDTLAPWLIDWGLDNRSAMVRIPPERGGASRLELRLGDASANPYLAVAGLLAAAYLGIRDELEPAAPLEGYGYDTSKADKLPGDLASALDAFEADTKFGEILGPQFGNTFVTYKRNELERFNHWITDWEFREYAYHL
jgi:glutamine synthetase